MSGFDQIIIEFLNLFSRQSESFDKAVFIISENHFFKGVVIMTLLWWAWLKDTGKLIEKDLFSIRTIGGAVLAIIVGRAMQNFMPMSLRPLHNPDIDFIIPFTVPPMALDGWSSFPSDHAVLFFALSTALWSRNRLAGAFAFAWTAIVICLPRVYLGFHYPTDIVGGAVLGIAVMLFVLRMPLPSVAWSSLDSMQRSHAGLLYAGIFLFSMQMSTLFEGARRFVGGVAKVIVMLV